MSDMPAEVDVAIVGAGPAGLSAAAELCALGVGRVLVLERRSEAGGVPRSCGHSPFGLREFHRPMSGPSYAAALERRARRAGAELMTSTTVTALEAGPAVAVSSDAGTGRIAARAVLLATGARETTRAGRMIGGAKPGGVMVTGALQDLVYGARLRPFRRPVVLGTELVAFSAILTCRHAGIRPVAMIEPGSRISARRPSDLLPRLLGIPVRFCTDIRAIEGRDRVEAVLLSMETGVERLAADGVIVTGQFVPEAALPQASGMSIDTRSGGPVIDDCGRCSVPGYYAAGNLLRPIETAGWCWGEGRRVAGAIAKDLKGGTSPNRIPVRLTGEALRYVVPQTLSRDAETALERLQLRVARKVRGAISLRVDGREVLRRRLAVLPERRVLLPIPREGTDVEVAIEETT